MIMGSWCTIYYKFLIGWVAVQYRWILDESVQYLGESEEINIHSIYLYRHCIYEGK